MTIDAITDAIYEYMYEKLNESSDSEESRRVKHIKDRKRRSNYEKPPKTLHKRKKA